MARRLILALLGVLVWGAAVAMPGFSTSTQTLSSATVTAPVPVISVTNLNKAAAPWLQPSMMVVLSAGASLTYSIEVTGDDVLQSGYNPATGNWSAMTNMSALTASAVATLGAAVTGVRLHITAYTSGTATFQFVQQTVN